MGRQKKGQGSLSVGQGETIAPQATTAGASETPLFDSPQSQSRDFLELEKLRTEISDLKRSQSWVVRAVYNVKLNEWLVAAAAIAAFIAALHTGIFDATRQTLTAQQERLSIEKLHLEQKKDHLAREVRGLENEVDTLKKKLGPFELERAAIEGLRSLEKANLKVRFAIDPDYDGLRVAIKAGTTRIGFESGPRPTANVNLRDAIRLINSLRSVKGLRFDYLILTPEEFELACQHKALEHLKFHDCNLSETTLSRLPSLPHLKSLDISFNSVSTLSGLGPFPSIKSLNLQGNPIDDRSLASLTTVFPSVMSLFLNGTQVTDEGMASLTKLTDLAHVQLDNTKVTGRGVLKLIENQRVLGVEIDKSAVSDEDRALIKKKRPNDFSLIDLDPREQARRAWQQVTSDSW
jgi:Leucine-rich repeat (LRR) protein